MDPTSVPSPASACSEDSVLGLDPAAAASFSGAGEVVFDPLTSGSEVFVSSGGGGVAAAFPSSFITCSPPSVTDCGGGVGWSSSAMFWHSIQVSLSLA